MPGIATKEDIEQFVQITGADQDVAQHFLTTGTSLQGALEDYFAAQPDAPNAPEDESLDPISLATENPVRAMSDNNSNNTNDQATAGAGGGGGGGGGPRTLGGQAVDDRLPPGWGQPEPSRLGKVGQASGGQSARRPGEVATLWNTGSAEPAPRGAPGGFGGGDDDDEDEDMDDPRRRGEELYAGGGRSGLAIENPNDAAGAGGGHRNVVADILRQARGNGPRDQPAADAASSAVPASSAFRGSGNTLGSDETPSEAVPAQGGPATDAAAPSLGFGSSNMMDRLLGSMPGGFGGSGAGAGAGGFGGAQGAQGDDDEEDEDDDEGERQVRRLTFWRDGFSIADGPLMRYDAPGNREILQAIQSGRAPPSLFGVRYDQPLQVEVEQRTNEDYVPPPKVFKGFEGEGNRLGSVVPDIGGAAGSSGTGAGAGVGAGAAAGAGTGQGQAQGTSSSFELDSGKPMTSIQVRLADGSKMVAKVNLTHTVADLRSYITASHPAQRAFVLQTTFPSKVLDDDAQTVEEAKLQNAVVVQRYT